MAKGDDRVPFSEKNNHPQGRSGSGATVKKIQGAHAGNATSGGGINRPTKGKS